MNQLMITVSREIFRIVLYYNNQLQILVSGAYGIFNLEKKPKWKYQLQKILSERNLELIGTIDKGYYVRVLSYKLLSPTTCTKTLAECIKEICQCEDISDIKVILNDNQELPEEVKNELLSQQVSDLPKFLLQFVEV